MPYAGLLTPLDNGAKKTTKEWEQDNKVYGIGAILLDTDTMNFKIGNGVNTYAELKNCLDK